MLKKGIRKVSLKGFFASRPIGREKKKEGEKGEKENTGEKKG